MNEKNYSVTLQFSNTEGQALISFLRRSNWSDFKSKSNDEIEAMKMESAVVEITKALIDAGVPWTFNDI